MVPRLREIVDLSHVLASGMPNLGEAITFWPVEHHGYYRTITGGKLSLEARMVLMPEHVGTHLDVPRHADPDGVPLEQVPLTRLVMPGLLLDLRRKGEGEAITVADLEAAERLAGAPIGPDRAAILWTGVDRLWGTPGFHARRPHVPVTTAEWLVDRGVPLVATDLVGVDDPAEWWWPTHAAWLTRNVCLVQQLRNLDRLEGKSFLFVCLPIAMRDGTGCPVRAVAMVFEDG